MLSGKKNFLFAAALIGLGIAKTLTDIEIIESITILGIADPSTLITTGIGWALGRDALAKIGR